jgi:hypothetical protein
MVSQNERKALAIFPANEKGRPRALCSIAFVQSWNDTADDMANARLIAASPVLLAACQTAFDALESAAAKDPSGPQAKALAQLRAAIYTAIPL